MTTFKPIRLSLFLTLLSLAAMPYAFSQDPYLRGLYQYSDYLQGGLYDAPAFGAEHQQALTTGDSEGITDLLHFSLSAGVRYDNNVFLTHNNKESDVIWSVTPTFSIMSAADGTALNVFSFSYSPSFQVYMDDTDRNTVNHNFSFRYGKDMPRSKLTFALNYSESTGSDRFVSGTIARNSVGASLNYNYTMTGKTSLNLSANTAIDVFKTNDLNDTKGYSLRASMPYQLSGKTSLGPSLSYSHSNVSNNNNQDDLQIGLTGTYKATDKTSLNGTLGYNFVGFDGVDAAGQKSTVTWVIGGSYQLSDKTGLSGSFYRTPKTSYNFDNAGYVATGISLNASHQYSERTSFFASVSYENDDYYGTSSNDIDMSDNYYLLTLGSSYRFDNGISCGANMTWRTNKARYDVNNFENFSCGLNASYNFW